MISQCSAEGFEEEYVGHNSTECIELEPEIFWRVDCSDALSLGTSVSLLFDLMGILLILSCVWLQRGIEIIL